MTHSHYDIVIVGSGIVGATMALLLAKNTRLRIALLEAKVTFPDRDRVSAISFASVRIFQHLQVWDVIQSKGVNPYYHMHVWDEGGNGQIHFDCAEVNESVLGYIIEDRIIQHSLVDALQGYPTLSLIQPIQLKTCDLQSDQVELTSMDGQRITAALLIAADGATSWVRAQANISLKTHDYGHTAIVTTVQTELSHQATAWQRFLATGPLAFLPLADPQRCSIVWSAKHEYAAELLALEEPLFCHRLTEAFDNQLGKVIHANKCSSFPLHMRHARHYVQERLALIGDAAHTIHPLAGQGVNLGLLDAACLAEIIATAVEKKRDFSRLYTLRRYERWRKAENSTMLTGVGMLKHLFAFEESGMRKIRSLGMSLVNQVPAIKHFLVRYALGKRGNLPRAAQR